MCGCVPCAYVYIFKLHIFTFVATEYLASGATLAVLLLFALLPLVRVMSVAKREALCLTAISLTKHVVDLLLKLPAHIPCKPRFYHKPQEIYDYDCSE